MNASPLVSIVIPAFNSEKVLTDALESVRTQTHTNFEALVVDDGSTDRTMEIASKYATDDTRFRCLKQSNAGSAVARNTALKQARGQWIAFLDSDDVWFPTKLETQLRLSNEDSAANLLFSNYWIWNGGQDRCLRYSRRREFPEGDLVGRLYRGNTFGTSTVMVRRDMMDRVVGFDPELRHVHDWDLWLRISEAGMHARGVWEPQIRYRIWSGNVTANRVRNATFAVRVMEKAVARASSQSSVQLADYRYGLRLAQARLELATAQSLIESSPREARAAVFRAWRCRPGRVEWLIRYLGLVWPAALGGRWTARAARTAVKQWRVGWRSENS
jgi:glycosyltransferase involved in cell wall biosynthesis